MIVEQHTGPWKVSSETEGDKHLVGFYSGTIDRIALGVASYPSEVIEFEPLVILEADDAFPVKTASTHVRLVGYGPPVEAVLKGRPVGFAAGRFYKSTQIVIGEELEANHRAFLAAEARKKLTKEELLALMHETIEGASRGSAEGK